MGLTNLGFRPCLDSGAFDCSEAFGMGLADASLFEQAVPLIAARPSPFYAFLVTLSNHMPFDLPERLRELPLDPALDQEVMGGYLQSVHYTDKHLGRFLDKLRQRGILDNTVVVITGDHQGVHKFYPQELARSPLAEPWWVEDERKLPLLIVARGLQPGEIATQGGQVDLMPTLLDLLGVDPGPWAGKMMGRNLLNTRRNLCALRDGRVLGQAGDPEALRHCREGLEIGDQIIRGNYFSAAQGSR
jgi:phosphoglycerol transferase MdoB-like AlkP superfamily enzyme